MPGEIEDVLAKMGSQLDQKYQKPVSPHQKVEFINPQSPKKGPNNVQEAPILPSKVQEVLKISQIQTRLQFEYIGTQKNQQNQQEEGSQYRQLSQKLETALKKIYNNKKIGTLQESNKLHSTFSFQEKKKQKDVQDRRKDAQLKKYYGLRDKPDINPRSKTIVQQTIHQPIYQRYQKILQEKRKKQQLLEHEKRQKEQEQYNQFLIQQKSHITTSRHARTATEFYNCMKTWKQKNQLQAQQTAQKYRNIELLGATFHPTINKNSKRLLQNIARVPIYQREVKPKVVNQEYTFTPKINKRKAI